MTENSHHRHETGVEHFLLRQFREDGNLEALGLLYQQYMHLVYGLCLKYFKNREDAKDGVMQIFEKLVMEVGKQDIRNFKSWLYVLSKNYCLMQLRSQQSAGRQAGRWQKDQEISMESEPDLHPIDEAGPDPDTALQECIERLKADQKKCIRLFYFQQWSYRQIAEILHLEEKTVKSHLQNAKRNLKICLEEKHVKAAER